MAPGVRWPNDIEVAGRKLAGVLVETAAHARAVVGIGVNTAGSAAALGVPGLGSLQPPESRQPVPGREHERLAAERTSQVRASSARRRDHVGRATFRCRYRG